MEIPSQEKLDKPDQHEILECALATSRGKSCMCWFPGRNYWSVENIFFLIPTNILLYLSLEIPVKLLQAPRPTLRLCFFCVWSVTYNIPFVSIVYIINIIIIMREKKEIIPSRYSGFMTVLHSSNESSRGLTSEHWSSMISVNDYNVHRWQSIRIADLSFFWNLLLLPSIRLATSHHYPLKPHRTCFGKCQEILF